MFRFVNIFIFSLLIVQSNLSAWWEAGHLAVAQIAYEELQPEVKLKVDEMVAAVSGSFPHHTDFVTAALWADDVKVDGIDIFSNWHVSSWPYDPTNILSEEEKEKMVAVIEALDLVSVIRQCVKTLKNPKSTEWAKGFMLYFLVHMVGDIHQPAHCVSLYNAQFPKGDRGGNFFKIDHPKYTNLHSLLDAAFGLADPEQRPQRPINVKDKRYLDALVEILRQKFPRHSLVELASQDVDDWRAESYTIGVEFIYANLSPGEQPSKALMEEGQEVLGRRLALAGYRLADLLNTLLAD